MTKTLQRVPLEVSIHWRYLHQDAGKTWLEISKMRPSYKKYSKATICRHMKKEIGDLVADQRKYNKGRPQKLSDRQKRNILRQTKILQSELGNFCVKRVMVRADIPPSVNPQTVRRVMKKSGLRWSHVQKKGILTKNDLKLRLKFARKVRRLLPKTFWTEGIAFYLDGASFIHKRNPFDQARAPRGMAWRKPGQGLDFGFTGKGSHEGTGGSVAHFIAAIAYGKGVIVAEQYFGRIDAKKFSAFVKEHFASMFKKSPNPKGKLFLQDGDPSQNSAKARTAWDAVGARKFSIPPRSPDLNPIENVFKSVKARLHEDALEKRIEREDFEEFSARVKATLESTPVDLVDNVIGSMNERIDKVVNRNGQRTRY